MSCLSGLCTVCPVCLVWVVICLGCLSFLPTSYIASVLYPHVFPCKWTHNLCNGCSIQ